MKRLFYFFLFIPLMAFGKTATKTCSDWYDGFSAAYDTIHSSAQTGQQDTMPLIRKYLDQWELSDTDCADRYTSEFNYHYKRAFFSGITMSVRKPPYVDQAMTLSDSTGGIAGYVYQGYMLTDTLHFEQSVDWLERALIRYPERLDIWQGEIMAFLYADDLERMIAFFDRFLAYSTRHTGPWLYTKDEPLDNLDPQEADPVVQTVQDRMNTLLSNEFYAETMQLTETALKYYPSSPVFLNDKAVIYYQQEDYEQALFWMQKASKAAPKDKLIKNNIKFLKKELKRRNKK